MQDWKTRFIENSNRLIEHTRVNDIKMYSIVIDKKLFQINVFRVKTPDYAKTEVWYSTDTAVVSVINGRIRQSVSRKQLEPVLYALEDRMVFKDVVQFHGIVISKEVYEKIVHNVQIKGLRDKREETVHRLLEMRNDYHLLYKTFGDERYKNRVNRIENVLISLEKKITKTVE